MTGHTYTPRSEKISRWLPTARFWLYTARYSLGTAYGSSHRNYALKPYSYYALNGIGLSPSRLHLRAPGSGQRACDMCSNLDTADTHSPSAVCGKRANKALGSASLLDCRA